MATAGKKSPRKFELNDVRTLGKQLLEALKFLHDKGIGHGKTSYYYLNAVEHNQIKSKYSIKNFENIFY